MNVKPMIFNTDMVRAMLDGRKVQTRRPVNVSEVWDLKDSNICRIITPKEGPWGVMERRAFIIEGGYEHRVIPAPVMPGDLIYVREKFRCFDAADECIHADFPCPCPRTGAPVYFADNPDSESKWKPSIHMPRWASRLTLTVTGVRVERVQDISATDCIAEGFQCGHGSIPGYMYSASPKEHFSDTWKSIYGESWERNDWVWVIDFEVIRQNVDDYLKAQEHAA